MDLSDVKPLDAVEIALDGQEIARDPSKDAVHIELPDGSVTINLGPPQAPDVDTNFDDNLAELLSESELATIGADLVMAIEEDDRTRSQWLEERADGLKHLALKIETPDKDDNRSKVRSTLLLESVLRFQANASGELMPADGPVKIRDDDQGNDTVQTSDLADALERDMNHYLTSTATEYYPDTDRMLFMLGFGGSSFKKVYRCPLRRRPVSESVDAADLIVSNAATDLGNADRVTHRVPMRPRVLKRMQNVGAYRKIDLSDPVQDRKDPVEEAKSNISGVSTSQSRPEDADYTIYESYCYLDLPGFEHKEGGEPSGIPLPYKVTVEKSSNEVLEIRRNWRADDEMQQRRDVFVEFTFVPGLGFYGLGLLQIAGNPTMAATTLLRCATDASIFANFPGMLHAQEAGRQDTNHLNIPPGASKGVKTNGMPIRDVVMPLPYKSPDGTMLELIKEMTESGARVAGTAEVQVGEGKQDAPVGTTIAMIEQATKVMDAVHKRLCRSQGKEIALLLELFREDPGAFWRFNKKPAVPWTKEQFIQALDDSDLVPIADPNTASHLQRIMRAQALYQMVTAAPQEWNIPNAKKIILKALQFNDPNSLISTPPPQPAGPPQDPAAQAKAEAAKVSAQADLMEAQTNQGQLQLDAKKVALDAQADQTKAQTDLGVAQISAQREERAHQADLQQQAMIEHANLATTAEQSQAKIASEHIKQAADHRHDHASALLGAALTPKPEKPTAKKDDGE